MTIDEPTMELLSRHLDGDLDEAEARALAVRLQNEQPLRHELQTLQQVAGAVRRVAESERPPAKLDSILEPLVLGPGPGRARRPWARWAAAAAVVVLGGTVVLEVSQRRSPEAPADRPARTVVRSAPGPGERFALAPLPSRPPDAEERPRGAVERLLAVPQPEVVTGDDVPPPLIVLGPLQTAPDPDAGVAEEDRDTAGGPSRPGDGARSDSDPAGGAKRAARAGPRGTGDAGRRPLPASAQGQLLVFLEGDTAWRSFEVRDRCQPGRYAVRVKVEKGAVRKVWPVWKPLAAPTESLQASELVLGLEIDGVADGEYPAEVVVEAKPPRTR